MYRFCTRFICGLCRLWLEENVLSYPPEYIQLISNWSKTFCSRRTLFLSQFYWCMRTFSVARTIGILYLVEKYARTSTFCDCCFGLLPQHSITQCRVLAHSFRDNMWKLDIMLSNSRGKADTILIVSLNKWLNSMVHVIRSNFTQQHVKESLVRTIENWPINAATPGIRPIYIPVTGDRKTKVRLY